jgi:hypothetical protein
MAVSQLPQAPYRQDRKILPTPLIADILFSEIRDCNRSEFPAYGTPHPNAVKWPNHQLVYIKPVDIERNEIFEFFYAADRANQDLYNWEYSKTEIRGVKYDSVVRTYLTLRDDFVQESPELDTVMPDVPAGVFNGTYTFFEKIQSRTGEKELDSIFVTEKHVYVDLSDVAISDLTTNDFGGILATKRDHIVAEGLQSETGFGIIEASTTSLGNGKSVQSIVRAPVDENGNPNYPTLEGNQIDSRYGVIFDYTRQIVEAGSVEGEITQNGAELIAVEVEPKDQWRSWKTQTRLVSLPEDQVWYGLRRENLPDILESIAIVGTERWVAVPTFKRVPDGPLKAKFTRKFSFGTPADYDPTNLRVPYGTESFQSAIEYTASSQTISTSSGTSISISSSEGNNQSTNTSESNNESSGSSSSTSNSSNNSSSTSNSSSSSNGTNSGVSFNSSSGTQASQQTSNNFNTGNSTSASTSSGSSSSTSSGSSESVSSSVGSSKDITTTSDSGVPLVGDPTITRSTIQDSNGNSQGTNSSSNSGTQSGSSTSSSISASASSGSSTSSGTSTSTGTTESSGTSASSGTSYQFGTSNSTNYSISDGSQTSTSYSKSTGTSGSISVGTNTSNSSSTSSSTSVSIGKTIFSLSIPKCLHDAIEIILPDNQTISVPATIPPTLVEGWFEVSRQAEHWKYGIWVTEIIEVYIPAI